MSFTLGYVLFFQVGYIIKVYTFHLVIFLQLFKKYRAILNHFITYDTDYEKSRLYVLQNVPLCVCYSVTSSVTCVSYEREIG